MTRFASNLLRSATVAVAVLGMTTLGQAQTKAPEGMPWFFQTLPDSALQGAWDTHRAIMGPGALSPKHKALVALAVSAQVPCEYCVIATTANAKKAGATDEEIREAIAVAAMIRFWSTVNQGHRTDMAKFKAHFGVPNN